MSIDYAEDMWVEAFKTGKHTDAAGNSREWTADDLQKIANTYNETTDRKAPVVLGHPTMDAPAYGWIDSVRVVGDKLETKLTQLNDKFVEALKAGAYKMRSISLYPNLNIRHLGFLGAMQPAVAGLAPFKFAENDNSIIYEFNEEDSMAESEKVKSLERENSFFRKVFDLFKANPGAPADHSEEPKGEGMADSQEEVVAPVAAPAEETVAVDAAAVLSEGSSEEPVVEPKAEEVNYAEQIQALNDELIAVKSERDSLKQELAGSADKARLAEHKSFCEALVAEGRMRPVDVAQNILNMELRYGVDAGSFSEESKETASLNSFKEYLSGMPKVCYFEEIATKKETVEFSEHCSSTDKISKYCDDMMAKDKNLSYAEAFKAVGIAHPDEMRSYLET